MHSTTKLDFIPKGNVERVNFADNTTALSKSVYWAEYFFPDQFIRYPGYSLVAQGHPSWVFSPEYTAELNGTHIVNVPAGSFNCTEVLAGGTQTWIAKDLPFPVKEQDIQPNVWTNTGRVVVHNYELVEIGQGIPTVPEFNPSYLVIGLPVAFAVLLAGALNKK